MPILIWIADNKEAVFAAEKITEKDGNVETNEIGFKMQGEVAIAFLNILFDEYKNNVS